MGWTFN